MAQDNNKPEKPRSEPEILPPDRSGGPNWPPQPSGFSQDGFRQTRGSQRIYVTRMGPLGFALLMLAVGLLAAVFLFVLIGTALIWIPVMAVIVLVAVVSRLFR